MPFNPRTWFGKPTTTTPIDAQNLNRIEAGIKDAHDALGNKANAQAVADALSGKLSKEQADAHYVPSAAHGEFNIARYGSITAAKFITDASMTAGSPVLHSATHTFTTADVGKKVGVRGAGAVSTDYDVLANDGVLVTTIASVSNGDAVLAASAVTTTSASRAVFGFPIDAAFIAAAQAATAAGGGTILIPKGRWLAAETLTYDAANVTVAGVGRSRSIVHYVHTGNGRSNATTPCFRGIGAGLSAGGKYEAGFRDFTVDGQFFVATTEWGSEMKLVQLTETVDATVVNMAILSCPATSLGYDLSIRCRIEGNTILNTGRLASIYQFGAGAAGSGIGIAIEPGSSVAACIIRDNYITGAYNAPLGGGRTGIHLEGIFSAADAATGTYIISGNVIKDLSIGIRDSGALGTIISNNNISACQWGIWLGTKGSAASRLPLDTIVEGNVIRDLVNRFGAPGTSYGIYVGTQTTTPGTSSPDGRILVRNNSIAKVPGFGIYVKGDPYPLNHVSVMGNIVRDCDSYGLSIDGIVNGFSVVHNGFIGNGRAGGGTNNAVRVGSTVVWTGGRIEGNDFNDYASPTTQANSISIAAGAVLTGVRRIGNTDDPAQSAIKGSTTTINNNATLATVSAFSMTLLANTTYQFEAVLDYSTDSAAGLKIRWAAPTGATLSWGITGAGAPDAGALVVTEQAILTGSGVGVKKSVRISGLLKTADTAGPITLTAAQNVATATDTVITARTVMSAARV